MNHNRSFNGKSLKDQEITNLQVTQSHNYSLIQNLLPRDLLGCLLLIFIIATMAPFFNYQLKAVGILIGGCYTLYFLKEKKSLQIEFVIYFFWLIWSFTGYLVSCDNELLVSLNNKPFFNTFFNVFQILVMGFTIAGITAHRGNLEVNFLGIVIGGIITFLVSAGSGELFEGIDIEEKVRVAGATTANLYGFILVAAVAGVLYFWGKDVSWRTRTVLILMIVSFTGGIIFSGSRKAFVGVIVLIIMWLFLCYRKELLKRPYYFIAFMFVFVGLYFVTNYMMSNTYMGKRFETELIEGGEERRVELYQGGIKMILKNPIFGIGFGNFKYLSRFGTPTHSDFAEVAVSTGIIGFLLYFSIYVLIWHRLSKIQKQVNNNSILYIIGLFKAIIIMILALGLGRPNFESKVPWMLLSSAIGYTWSLERKLLDQFNNRFGKEDIIASYDQLGENPIKRHPRNTDP